MATCKICGESFYSKQTRARHIDRVHDEVYPSSESEDDDPQDEDEPESENEYYDDVNNDSLEQEEEEEEEDQREDSAVNEQEKNAESGGLRQIEAVIAEAIHKKVEIDYLAWQKCQKIVKDMLDL